MKGKMPNETRPQWLKQWLSDPKNEKLYLEEKLILDVTERIIEAMERSGVTRSDLARRLGVSRALVSRLLDGSSNMTLRTLANVCFVLDLAPEIELLFLDEPVSRRSPKEKLTLSFKNVVYLFPASQGRGARRTDIHEPDKTAEPIALSA